MPTAILATWNRVAWQARQPCRHRPIGCVAFQHHVPPDARRRLAEALARFACVCAISVAWSACSHIAVAGFQSAGAAETSVQSVVVLDSGNEAKGTHLWVEACHDPLGRYRQAQAALNNTHKPPCLSTACTLYHCDQNTTKRTKRASIPVANPPARWIGFDLEIPQLRRLRIRAFRLR
jgi:hypothetical protein